ncbi:MAG: ROK family protein [Bacteroidetes bacterium]|nr:ROK family protein [Bacteroidota bacterium]MBS1609176.1 ROK family protein [Bacteroidota bacterium]
MGNKKFTYRKDIIKQLYFHRSLSCADVSYKIGKSLPLTTKMLTELIDEDYVIETGYANSTGGRRPQMYSLRNDFMYIVSVAMDQFVTRIAIMDMQNNPVIAVEKFELTLSNNSSALAELSDKIIECIKKSGIDECKIIGIGIGMPGFVDVLKGINYTFLDAGSKSIEDYISLKTNLPVFIDNDSRLIALAELSFGKLIGKKNAMVINIGWGVGLGLIVKGELFRGQNGFAGEFSHIPLFSNNKLCSCGKMGCLETEASLFAVIEKTKEGIRSGKLSHIKELPEIHHEQACEIIIEAAKKGDKFAIEILSDAGYHIGRGLAVLIHLFNPETIILSGRGSQAGRLWQAPIQQALNEHCIPRLALGTEIQVSQLGHSAELIGAAALVMERFENDLSKATFSETELP